MKFQSKYFLANELKELTLTPKNLVICIELILLLFDASRYS